MFELAMSEWPMLVGGCAVATLGSVAAWRTRTLTWSGAIGMALIAMTILLTFGPVWLTPMFVFFASSVLIGRLGGAYAPGEPEVRSLAQVLANGTIGTLGLVSMFFIPEATWQLADATAVFFGAIAAANADTWATEIGTRYGGVPRNIVTGRVTQPGTSGGVTNAGMVGAAIGSILIALTLPMVLAHEWNPRLVICIALAGWIGALVDSFLGAVAQRRYRCHACGMLIESRYHCDRHAETMSGILSNNAVNWFCTAAGAFVAWALFRWSI